MKLFLRSVPLSLIQEGQLSYTGKSPCKVLANCLEDYACPRKSVCWLNDLLNMTITVLTGP